jgi:NADPH:quinone reductase-like Zn-dependent oxidoreductase
MHEVGVPPAVEELADPRPQRGEVLVKVVATGV